MSGASMEATLGLWASELRDVKLDLDIGSEKEVLSQWLTRT
jgi:hypothetical protein